jgi:CRP-like cAMP-binding protein
MKVINSPNLLKKYIELYNIKSIFSNDLEKYMTLYQVKKGELLLSTSEKVTFFYLLVSGGTKIVLNLENGKSLLIDYSKPLEMLGEMEIINSPYSKYDVVATEDSTLIGIPMETFAKLIDSDPIFWKYLYSSTIDKLQSTVNSNIISSSYSFEHVLANYLITHAIEVGDQILVESINFSDLSQLLGTSYRHLNRVLKKFIDKGLIDKDKRKIIITNYDKLSEYYVELY